MDMSPDSPPHHQHQHSHAKNQSPFVYSRLRGYTAQVDNVIDAKASIANAMAVAYTHTLSTSNNQLPPLSGEPYQSLTAAAATSPAAAVPQQVMQEIGALRAEIAGMESVIGFMKAASEGGVSALGRRSSPLPTQQQLRQRAELYIRTLTDAPLAQANASLRRSGSPMAPGADSFRMTRWMDDSTTRSCSASSAQGAKPEEGFERLTRDLKTNRTWRPGPAAQPVGRGEAIVLEAALDEALPQGGIAAKYQPWADVSQSTAQVFILSQDIARDFDSLESVQREAARQVSAHCTERGQLLLKVAERYREFFSVLHNTVGALRTAKSQVVQQLDEMTARCSSQEGVIEALRQQLAAERQATERERELRVQVETQLEHVQHDAELQASKLQAENQILAAEVDHLMDRLEAAREEGEAALTAGTAQLQQRLGVLEDEKDGLAQRIRFLERQIIKMREEMRRTTPTQDSGTEMDPALLQSLPQESEEEEEEEEEGPVAQQQGSESVTRVRKKHSRALGGFSSLITSGHAQGRIRGAHWTITCIAQLYVDKIVADTVSDREGNPRPGICEFTYDWHLTRYGLRNLAESNLLDLLASVKHHARRLQRIRWFGVFTGLVESGEKFDTPQHLAFYLFVLQQLAYPSSITGLFACESGSDDSPVLIKQQLAQEAVKAVFRYLNDPDAAAKFLSSHVENQPVDPEIGVAGVVRVDTLVRMLMTQYRNRVERNVAHLKALFRAGDPDKDGLISYDEFVMLFKHANPDTPDRVMNKIYGEAVRLLPHGQYLIPQDIFIGVAHTYGLDRWRIDAGGLNVMTLAPDSPATGLLTRGLSLRLKDQAAIAKRSRTPGRPGREAQEQSDQNLLRLLDNTLSSLDPSLDEMMAQARERVAQQPAWIAADPDLLTRLAALHQHMADARSGPDGSGPDAAGAWLCFRLLYAALTAVLTRRNIVSPPAPRVTSGRRTTVLVNSGAWRAGPVPNAALVSGLAGGDGLAAAKALDLRGSGRSGGGGGGRLSPQRLASSAALERSNTLPLSMIQALRPSSRSPTNRNHRQVHSSQGDVAARAAAAAAAAAAAGGGDSMGVQQVGDWVAQQQQQEQEPPAADFDFDSRPNSRQQVPYNAGGFNMEGFTEVPARQEPEGEAELDGPLPAGQEPSFYRSVSFSSPRGKGGLGLPEEEEDEED